jgi:hypothetical protein
MSISAYACTVKGELHEPTIINSTHARRARNELYRDVNDCYPIHFIDVRVRKIGGAHTSDEFKRTAAYRGMPGLKCGQPVDVDGSAGYIVGHNSSANFDVLFVEGKLAGGPYNVHPSEITLTKHTKTQA